MAKVNAPLLGLNAGEVSRIALSRVDLAKLRLAAQCQVNWQPFVVGAMMLRPGLEFVGQVKNDVACELLSFVYSKTDTAQIELTNATMRVRIADALVARTAVSTAISDPNFAGGGTWSLADSTAGTANSIGGGSCVLTCSPVGGLARVKQTITVALADRNVEHGLRIGVTTGPVTIRIGSLAGAADQMAQTVLDTGTHSLSFTPTVGTLFLQIESTDQRAKGLSGCTIEPAGTVELPTPWTTDDLPNLRVTQSGDIIYVAAYGLQQYKIERRGSRPGARGWSVVRYRSDNGPFLAGPDLGADADAERLRWKRHAHGEQAVLRSTAYRGAVPPVRARPDKLCAARRGLGLHAAGARHRNRQ